MALIAPYIRITHRLKITGQKEIGETHLTLGDPDNTFTAMQGIVDGLDATDLASINTAFATYVNATTLKRANYAQYSLIKVAAIGTDGKYAGEAAKLDLSGAFGTDTDVLPQDTLAVTLRTASTHRWGRSGRMFLPFVRGSLSSSSPFLSSTVAASVADAMRQYVEAVNSIFQAIESSLSAVVVHKKLTAAYFPITSVYVGNVHDTQQRRRNKLEETYVHHDLT